MICHACGAKIPDTANRCPLCDREIDRSELYAGFIREGDRSLETGDLDRAAVNYKKAIDAGAAGPEIYLKLGSVYERKGDKMAAGMYLKAIGLDFSNDRAHNLLIGLYHKHGRLNDIRAWYKKSLEAGADPVIVGKYLKIIEAISVYASGQAPLPEQPKKPKAAGFVKSLKSYMIMNIVVGIVITMFALAGMGAILFKINTTMVFLFAVVFLIATTLVVFYYRVKKINDVKKKSMEEFLDASDLKLPRE